MTSGTNSTSTAARGRGERCMTCKSTMSASSPTPLTNPLLFRLNLDAACPRRWRRSSFLYVERYLMSPESSVETRVLPHVPATPAQFDPKYHDKYAERGRNLAEAE